MIESTFILYYAEGGIFFQKIFSVILWISLRGNSTGLYSRKWCPFELAGMLYERKKVTVYHPAENAGWR